MTDRARAGLGRRRVAEAVGTAFLLAAVVGSGIMGERPAGGNAAVALRANTLADASQGELPVFFAIVAQLLGAAATALFRWLVPARPKPANVVMRAR